MKAAAAGDGVFRAPLVLVYQNERFPRRHPPPDLIHCLLNLVEPGAAAPALRICRDPGAAAESRERAALRLVRCRPGTDPLREGSRQVVVPAVNAVAPERLPRL